MICPYCNGKVELVSGNAIYPHRSDLHDKHFWLCAPCDAYVGCHDGTTKPLGRLANTELRQAKIAAHSVFDPLWQRVNGHRRMTRNAAYGWLADQLGVSRSECHIGMMDVDRCRLVVALCNFYGPSLSKQGSN